MDIAQFADAIELNYRKSFDLLYALGEEEEKDLHNEILNELKDLNRGASRMIDAIKCILENNKKNANMHLLDDEIIKK